MLKALAFGLGIGAAIQAFRNVPPDGPLQADALAVLFIVGLAAAYGGGKHRRGAGSVAVAHAEAHADATSVATNTVQVAVVVPGGGAGADSAGRIRIPSDKELPEWFGSGELRPVVSSDQLEGMDASELSEVLEVGREA